MLHMSFPSRIWKTRAERRDAAMNNEHREFLNLRRLPGSIDTEQTAMLLGIPTSAISILVSKGFLKPLGKNIAPNAPRRFASAAIIMLTQNSEEMHKMQHFISSHWRERNGTQTCKPFGSARPSNRN